MKSKPMEHRTTDSVSDTPTTEPADMQDVMNSPQVSGDTEPRCSVSETAEKPPEPATAGTPTEPNTPARNRGGAPKNNHNAWRHGLRAGTLAPDAKYISNSTNQLRRQIEREVLDDRGRITVTEAALIQSCIRHEIRAQLTNKWLRESESEKVFTTTSAKRDGSTASRTTSAGLSIMERAQLLRELSAASDSRDKCLERLNLPTGGSVTPWSALYTPAIAHRPASPVNGTSDDTEVVPTGEAVTSDSGASDSMGGES